MVVKDVQRRASQWRDPQNWRNRLPREIQIHELIEERRNDEPGCQYLVRYYGYRLLMSSRRYRIYLDYYDASNLHYAMTHHFQRQTDIPLPEKFIWYIAKALASACLILQQGTTSPTWTCIWATYFWGLENESVKMARPKMVRLETTKMKQKETKNRRRPQIQSNGPIQTGRYVTNSVTFEISCLHVAKELPIRPVLADFGLSFYSLDSGGCPISDNPRDYFCGANQTRYAPVSNLA
jgi:hypothetical protein